VLLCFPLSWSCLVSRCSAFLCRGCVSEEKLRFPLSTVLHHRCTFFSTAWGNEIALPCFQFRFHTSSPYFVFRFFSFDLPILSSSISISISFSFHLPLRSIFCFWFCPNFVPLFDFLLSFSFNSKFSLAAFSFQALACTNPLIYTRFSQWLDRTCCDWSQRPYYCRSSRDKCWGWTMGTWSGGRRLEFWWWLWL